MKRILRIFFLAVLVTGCREKTDNHMSEMDQNPKLAEKNMTKLVKTDGLQVAFDLMTMPYHMQMMKLMKVDMKYVEGATHGLMVTVMDDKTKTILSDAEVMLTITDPDGMVKTEEPEIMHGSGMHHYAVHIKAKKGKYLLRADIKYNGRKYIAESNFDVKE